MAEATPSSGGGGGGGGGRGFRFWKKSRPASSDAGQPTDTVKTGCGGFFRRVKGRRKAPTERATIQQEAGNGCQSQSPPPAPQITFDDVQLPEVVKQPAGCGGGGGCDGDGSDGSSVHSVCEEIVCVKVKQAESAWVRPPVAAAPKEKPRLALAKMASRDDGKQPRRPSDDKLPTTAATTATATALSTDAEPQDEAEAERQRMAEARFQRKSIDMRSVKAKGGVKIEQSPQSEMWWNIVNKSLVGTGLFERAVACSLQSGGVFACNPADFAPTCDQVAALRDNFQNPAAFAAAGFAIGGALYKVEQGGCTRDLLSAVNLQHTEGLLVVTSKSAMLIAGFAGSRDQARETLRDMRDLFVSQGL